jgi:isopenicillin-N epimerase
LIVSFGWETDVPGSTRLVDYYEYMGTRDYAAFLAVPDAIEFQRLNQWDQVRKRCHAYAQNCLIQAIELTREISLYDPHSDWYAQMVTIPLPGTIDLAQASTRLLTDFHIVAPVLVLHGHPFIRISFQAYNSLEDLNSFIIALHQLLGTEQRL